jgi:hypothetical protein
LSDNDEDEEIEVQERETITTSKNDIKAMFGGGPMKKITYFMDYVPLRIGVMIRPE